MALTRRRTVRSGLFFVRARPTRGGQGNLGRPGVSSRNRAASQPARSASVILRERRGPIAWITVNRAVARNTLDSDAFIGLADAWAKVRRDDAGWRSGVPRRE